MDINLILLWCSGIALATDFLISLFSRKYRKYGGHLIGAMAYIILLTDLTYSLYLGNSNTPEFRMLLKGVLIVGGLFIVEYTVNTYKYIRQHERGVAAHRRENTLEDELKRTQAEMVKLTQHNQWLQELANERANMMNNLSEQRDKRIQDNMQYEDLLTMESETASTRNGFLIYTQLTRGYEGEREPKFERKLHNVCEKLSALLAEDEIACILHINAEKSRTDADFYDAT